MNLKKFTGIVFPLFTLALIFRGLFISDAYAYLDPGTGSLVIQIVIGALVGAGIAVKVFWIKLKYKFSSIFKKG
ncbi:MAG: hypothetical protein HRO68_00660 [Nitrosopumilus sp.]|nr:hypothetical protein [Nitrosopumilus sp.]